jgi:hypothetical protein
MATTTNYGWTTPDDTALVKDGAAAIRTLGSSVDTTTKALNPSTTLGDVEYRSSTANTNTRLGIGTTGQVLTVSGGVPAWSTISAGGMTLLATTTLASASTVVSSISQDYKQLHIVGTGITHASGENAFRINPNSSSGNVRLCGIRETTVEAVTNIQPLSTNRTSDAGNAFVVTIDNYTSTGNKGLICYGRHSVGDQSTLYGGVAIHAAAITSLQYTSSNGSSLTGTILLYGVN